MQLAKIVYYILMGLALIASFAGYKNRKYVLFIPLLALSLAVELAREFLQPQYQGFKNALGLFNAVEYAFLSLIISNFIYSRQKKRIIRASIFVLVPFLIFIKLSLADKSPSYKYLDLMITAPFLCVWTILYLFETVNKDEEFEIASNPMFWISLGNLLFFSGSFFSYGFGAYLNSKGSHDMANTIFWIARILNILLYILYFIGFICLMRKKSF